MDNENIVTTSGGGKIIDVEINKEMKKSFLDYSMSVIMSRALPDGTALSLFTEEYFIQCTKTG